MGCCFSARRPTSAVNANAGPDADATVTGLRAEVFRLRARIDRMERAVYLLNELRKQKSR